MMFIIKEGKHRPFFTIPRITFKKRVHVSVFLDGDFSYTSDKMENQRDTNKIFGLSDNWHHHKDSFRIGYRYLNGRLELMAYYYSNGKKKASFIDYINTNNIKITLTISENDYTVEYKNKVLKYPRTSKWRFFRYYLYPYFGGEEKAKKDLCFRIKIT